MKRKAIDRRHFIQGAALLGLTPQTASALDLSFAAPTSPRDEQIYRGLGDLVRQHLAHSAKNLIATTNELHDILRSVMTGTTQRVAFFGDSITAAGHRSTVLPYSEFIRYLSWLNPYEGIEVANFGVAGDTSRNGLARLKDVLDFRPQTAVVMFGTNDHCVLIGSDNSPFSLVSLDEYRENMNIIVDQLLSAGTTPLLCTLPPLKPAFGEWAVNWGHAFWPIESNSSYARVVRDIASARALPWLDVNELLKVYDVGVTIFEDGIHVTTEGHLAMARGILRVLAGLKR